MSQPGRRKGRQLSPEEKWEVFLEVTSQELTQADAARKWQVDVSTIIKIRRLAKDAVMSAPDPADRAIANAGCAISPDVGAGRSGPEAAHPP
jgi:transposase-like protein